MSTSRRQFIGATSAALSAPLAGIGAAVVHAQDDVVAIRALLHEHAQRLGARPDAFGSQERIEIGADGRTGRAALPCVMDVQTVIGPDCPLVDMARQQGGGVERRIERGVLEASCVKRDGAWTLEDAAFRPTT
jgi:hypothetical protein